MHHSPSELTGARLAGCGVAIGLLLLTLAPTSPVAATPASPAAPAQPRAQVGTNDFRLTDVGGFGTTANEVTRVRTAYNSATDQYLVVYQGDENGDTQTEIYGQLIDARTGAEVGANDFLIAAMGPTVGELGPDALDPVVAYNATDNEFVVAFVGDNTDDPDDTTLVDTYEIYAKRVSAAGVVNPALLRVSDMGSNDANDSFDADQPDIAYNADDDELVVVWRGDDDTGALVNNELEIFGQRLGYSAGTLVELGTDLRISDAGPDGNGAYDAHEPSVAYGGGSYVVAYRADDNASGGVDQEFDIFVQQISAAGAESGVNDRRITPVDGTAIENYSPDIAWNETDGEFLLGWEGEEAAGLDFFEIYGNRLDASGAPVAATFAISNIPNSPKGTPSATAIAHNPRNDEYLVVWRADDSNFGADEEYQVYGKRISATGATIEGTLQLSDASDQASQPWVSWSEDSVNSYFVPFTAADTAGGTVAGENEVFGQFVATNTGMAITKTLTSSNFRQPGDAVQYLITYSNAGPDTVFDVVIQDALSPNLSNPAFTYGGVTPTEAGTSPYTWTIPSLTSGQSGTITIDATLDNTPPVTDGQVITNTATIATTTVTSDSAANDSSSATLNVDMAPTVTVNQAGGQSDPASDDIDFTATFSEAVTGFTAADIDITGTVVPPTSVVVTGGPTTYNIAVTVSGTNPGNTVIAGIPADAANDADQGSKPSEASTSTDNSVLFDNVAPSVTVDQAAAQPDPTNLSPINFTVIFDEAVIGFDNSDIVLGGSAGATTAVVTGVGPTYNVAVSGMTGDGTVSASINASAATDPAGNASAASTSLDNTVQYDTTAPTVTLNQAAGQADPTADAAIDFTVVFSESVTGFDGADISIGGSAGATSALVTGSGTTYNVAVSGMTGDGDVTANVSGGAGSDLAGNTSAASTSLDNTVTFDSTAPSATINQAVGQADPTNASPINFTVVFSEPVTGFDDFDITLGGTAGATTAVVSGSSTTYNVAVSGMTGDGTVSASVAAGAAVDAGGTSSLAAVAVDDVVEYDASDPSVTINQAAGQADPTNAGPINFTVVFSEPVVGFGSSDITLSGTAGPTAALVTGVGPTYNVAVSGMTGDGTVVAQINAGVATDGSGNASLASTSTDNTVSFDATPPTVTINQAAGQSDPVATIQPVSYTVVFSEPVTGFTSGDVTLAGSAGATTAVVSGSGATYNVVVSGMTHEGTVVASLAAAVAADLAANASLASTSTDNVITISDAGNPVAVSDSVSGVEEQSFSIDVLANDTVIDGATLGLPSATSAHGGSIAVSPAGTVAYNAPAGFVGTDTITYRLCDNDVPTPTCSTATVTITLTDQGSPVAVADVVDGFAIPGVVKFFRPFDNDILTDAATFTFVNPTEHGATVAFAPDAAGEDFTTGAARGVVGYTAPASFTGVDTVTYTICDDDTPVATCSTTTVRIEVRGVTLPATGSDVRDEIVTGLLLVIGGLLLVRHRRRTV